MTAKAIYSFGEDSPIKFEISDKLAENYNAAVEQFFKAQQRFNQKFGRQWDPAKEPIAIKWSTKQRKAWNQFGEIFNRVIEEQGPFHENDLMDDFLVRNSPAILGVMESRPMRLIDFAVGLGSVYGIVRR